MSTPYEFPQPFVDACNDAMWRVGVNLARLTLEVGPRDFPQDGGVAYRNHLYKYVHCYFICTLYPYLLPDADDPWTRRNRELVLKLQTEPLQRAAGLSHAYVRGRQLFLSVEKSRAQAARNPALVSATEQVVAKAFHWLVMYDLPPDIPKEWSKLITTGKDMASFTAASQSFFYSQLSSALGLDRADAPNAAAWSNIAMLADQAVSTQKPEEWQPFCEQLMALYVDEAKRVKTQGS